MLETYSDGDMLHIPMHCGYLPRSALRAKDASMGRPTQPPQPMCSPFMVQNGNKPAIHLQLGFLYRWKK